MPDEYYDYDFYTYILSIYEFYVLDIMIPPPVFYE